MKKYNFHLIAVVLTLLALITFNWQYGSETNILFGFAENKEMEIRLEHPVAIQKIHVTAGVKVKKGEVIMEATRSGLDLTQSDLKTEVASLQSELSMWQDNLKSSIRQLQAQKTSKENEIRYQIAQLESEIALNKSLVKDLKSIEPAQERAGMSPVQIKIDGLKKSLFLAVEPLETEINKFEHELKSRNNPIRFQIDQLNEKLNYAYAEEEKLTILAPEDGVVGYIFCKEGEQFSAFNTLLTFYEENPTQVKGYVLENLIFKVNLGDEIQVNSTVKSSTTCKGKVEGMGSRIVEIPERLRKNPTFKTYGREILITIPADNKFLQKEKVVLKLINDEDDVENKPIRVFTPPITGVASLLESGSSILE